VLTKRIVVCLDVRNGALAKSVKFVDTRDIGDPVAKAREYYEQGVDELVFYDISAAPEGRGIMIDTVSRVAAQIFVPFSVGGGVRTVEDATALRLAGAEKINVNSAAVERPALIDECAAAIGSQSTVLAVDVRRAAPGVTPSSFEIVTHGGRRATGKDALAWVCEGVSRGAGEIVVNSIDADGTKAGYDLELTRQVADAVPVPVIASGGAGTVEHIYQVLSEGRADAALVASVVHFGLLTIAEIKRSLAARGVPVRGPFA
jgi:imidazole glycerol-phosphate synthase subunit HisF